MLQHGLYEQVINRQLNEELALIPKERKVVAPIDTAEASKILSQYLMDVVQKGLDNLVDNGGDMVDQIALANQIVNQIQASTKEEAFSALNVDRSASQLWTLMQENLYALSDSPVMLGEIMQLLQYRFEQIVFIDESVALGFDCPLNLHCTYTRDQVLVAMDFMKPATVREGVQWLPDKQLDVFFVTLNKSDKDYLPTTMYNDYSINESMFHWQSQSTTSESPLEIANETRK